MEDESKNCRNKSEDRFVRISNRMKELKSASCEYSVSSKEQETILLIAACMDYLMEFGGPDPVSTLGKLEEFSKTISPKSLKTLLTYVKNKKIDINEENIDDISEISKLFRWTDILDESIGFCVKCLTPRNVITLLKVADSSMNENSKRIINEYAAQYFIEMSNQRGFFELPPDVLANLLKSNDLNVSSEKEVFEALKGWILYDKKGRFEHLNDLLELIKLPLLPIDYLFDVVISFIQNIEKSCNTHLNNSMQWHLLPRRRLELNLDVIPRNSTNVLLLVGDWDNGKSQLVDVYDPKTNVWSHYMNLKVTKWKFGVACLDDRLLLVGGESGNECVSSVEMVNLKTQCMVSLPNLNYPRRHSQVVECDGYVYAIGGSCNGSDSDSVERWDPETMMWTVKTPMRKKRVGLAVVALNGKIYAIGGGNDEQSTEIYDIKTNSWSDGPKMTIKRRWVSATKANGQIYAFGGADMSPSMGAGRLKTAEVLDFDKGKWIPIPDLLQHGDGFATYGTNDKIYVAGGFHHQSRNHFQEYDIKSRSWKTLPSTLDMRMHSRLVSVSRDVLGV